MNNIKYKYPIRMQSTWQIEDTLGLMIAVGIILGGVVLFVHL